MLKLRRRRVVVNTVTGKTFVGELLLSWPWQYRLRGTDLLEANAAPVRIDGVAVIPRRVVEFLQIAD